MASQHLDSVQDKFHLHNFSHSGKELLEIGKQYSGALSKHILKPADITELVEGLPDVIPVTKGKNVTRRKQMKSSTHDEEYFGKN
jgi:hypothetical protein